MKINFSNWTINQKLALAAFLLGFAAMFLHDPLKSTLVTVDLNDLSQKVRDKSANVNVEDLANWIIQKKSDYILIDIRNTPKYQEYSIPGAVNIFPADINKVDYPKTQKIIIYSDDALEAAQVWFVLKSKNYKGAYLLSGGIKEWTDKILFPSLSENATAEEKAKFAQSIEISKYFGGSPQLDSTGTEQSKTQVILPKVKVISTPAMKTGKKKREGC
ncbi:MAG: rhodanese-like domain-containing protein [bacterium]